MALEVLLNATPATTPTTRDCHPHTRHHPQYHHHLPVDDDDNNDDEGRPDLASCPITNNSTSTTATPTDSSFHSQHRDDFEHNDKDHDGGEEDYIDHHDGDAVDNDKDDDDEEDIFAPLQRRSSVATAISCDPQGCDTVTSRHSDYTLQTSNRRTPSQRIQMEALARSPPLVVGASPTDSSFHQNQLHHPIPAGMSFRAHCRSGRGGADVSETLTYYEDDDENDGGVIQEGTPGEVTHRQQLNNNKNDWLFQCYGGRGQQPHINTNNSNNITQPKGESRRGIFGTAVQKQYAVKKPPKTLEEQQRLIKQHQMLWPSHIHGDHDAAPPNDNPDPFSRDPREYSNLHFQKENHHVSLQSFVPSKPYHVLSSSPTTTTATPTSSSFLKLQSPFSARQQAGPPQLPAPGYTSTSAAALNFLTSAAPPSRQTVDQGETTAPANTIFAAHPAPSPAGGQEVGIHQHHHDNVSPLGSPIASYTRENSDDYEGSHLDLAEDSSWSSLTHTRHHRNLSERPPQEHQPLHLPQQNLQNNHHRHDQRYTGESKNTKVNTVECTDGVSHNLNGGNARENTPSRSNTHNNCNNNINSSSSNRNNNRNPCGENNNDYPSTPGDDGSVTMTTPRHHHRYNSNRHSSIRSHAHIRTHRPHETIHAQSLLLGLAFCFIWTPNNLMAPNLTEIANSFDMSNADRDLFLGSYCALATGVLSFPISAGIGVLTDFYSRQILFVITVAGGALSSMATAYCTTYWQLFFCRLLNGGFMSGSVPVAFSFLGDLFHVEERNAASSGLTAMMGLGLIAGQVYAGTTGPLFGWRHSFTVSGAATFVLAILCFCLVKEPKRGGTEKALQDMIKAGTNYNRKLTWQGFLYAVRHNKSNFILLWQGFFSSLPWGVIFVFLNDYLSQERGFSVPDATFMVLIFGVGCFFGGILGGYWGGILTGQNLVYLPLFMAVTTLLGTLPFLGLLNTNFHNAHGVVSITLSFLAGLIPSLPSVNVRPCLINVNPPETRGASLTAANLLVNLGRGVGPSCVTLMTAIWGVNRQFAFNVTLSVFWAISAGQLVLLARTLPKDQKAMIDELENYAKNAMLNNLNSYPANGTKDQSADQPEFSEHHFDPSEFDFDFDESLVNLSFRELSYRDPAINISDPVVSCRFYNIQDSVVTIQDRMTYFNGQAARESFSYLREGLKELGSEVAGYCGAASESSGNSLNGSDIEGVGCGIDELPHHHHNESLSMYEYEASETDDHNIPWRHVYPTESTRLIV